MNSKNIIIIAALTSTLAVVACSVEEVAAPESNEAKANEAKANGDNEASDFEGLCTAQFESMVERKAKCGNPTLKFSAQESARKDFMQLCKIQSARTGTGFTAAFRVQCANAMRTVACDDEKAIVDACLDPVGIIMVSAAGCLGRGVSPRYGNRIRTSETPLYERD